MSKQSWDARTPCPWYWAFNCNPKVYDIDTALRAVTDGIIGEDTWKTTQGMRILPGEQGIVWRTQSSGVWQGRRGVIALVTVLSEPTRQRTAHPHFYCSATEDEAPVFRTRVEYQLTPKLPLLLENQHGYLRDILENLNVNGGQGSSFHLESAEWDAIWDAVN